MSAATTTTADAVVPGTTAAATPAAGDLADRIAAAAARVEADVAAVDRHDTDVRAGLRHLGEAGLLTLGVAGRPGTLAEQAAVLRSLARVCLATAFSAWAQRMAVEYVAAWGTDRLRTEVLDELGAGARPGATAMASAFQDALGLREVPVTARPHGDGGLVLDGTVPWASNLFPDGAEVVLPVRDGDGRRSIVAVRTDTPGVRLPPTPALLALDATASGSLHLDEARVPASRVLTDRFLDFLGDVRGPFLLLQTAFCLGLVDAALVGAAGRFTGPAVVLEADHDELVARRDRLGATHDRLLARGRALDREVVELRLEAGQLGVAATRHEASVRGGASYLAASPTARRLREAAFLPIQSPTEAQLRWELSRSV